MNQIFIMCCVSVGFVWSSGTILFSLGLLSFLQGKLLHCEPPPGVDSVSFKSHTTCVKKEKTRAHPEKQCASAVSVFCCLMLAVVSCAPPAQFYVLLFKIALTKRSQ